MKRICIILSLLLFLFPIFANNMQQTYTVEDAVYKRVDRLCQIAGVVGPTSFSPTNARALEIALNRIDSSKLTNNQRAELEKLYALLKGSDKSKYIYSEEYLKFDLDMSVNLQFNLANYNDFDFISSGKHDSVRLEEQMLPYRFESPAISLYPKFFFGSSVFMEADFAIKNNVSHMYESSFGWLMTDYNGFSFFGGKQNTAYAPELPYKAGISVGNNYFNFMLGRYQHSIGSGFTGNMVVGNNFTYQEIATTSFMSNFFTYNLSITRFDLVDNKANNITSPTRKEFTGPQQFRVVHHFDFNILNYVKFGVDMATIYTSDFGFDMRFFYPFVIGHNYYNYTNYIDKTPFDEANNISAINLDIALPKGFRLSSQFVLDQFQTYFEDKTSVPSAFGVLANISNVTSIGEGTLTSYFESVYTNPYLYLNGKVYKDADKITEYIDYNLDYFVGYHTQYLSDYNFSGYRFGPDSLVFAIGTNYDSNAAWSVGLDILYKAQGEKRVKYNVTDVKNTDFDMNNTHIERDPNARSNGILSTGFKNAEHFIQVKINGSYNFEEYNLELFGIASLNSYINYNLKLGDVKVIPQFSFGVKWNGL